MNIVVESPFKINEMADKTIKEKLNSLDDFKMGITQVDLYFKLGDGVQENTVISQIEIRKPGPTIYADSDDPDFLKAFNEALSKAKRQLVKAKEQLKSHH